MSEKYTPAPEARPSDSSPEASPSERSHRPEHTKPDNELLKNIDRIRQDAERQSVKAETVMSGAQEKDPPAASRPYVDKQLKNMAYSRLLNRARKQLNPLEKPLSKFMHQPVVDAISETAAKSIGRPSGLLGGGTVALVGTSIYYYIAKHYGYEYNFFVFIFLMAAGFAAGWSAELLFKLRRAKH